MSVRFTHIRVSSNYYSDHEHISDFRWVSYENGDTGESSKAAMVEWINAKGGEAFVESANTKVAVGVVKPRDGDPYLRTYANGVFARVAQLSEAA